MAKPWTIPRLSAETTAAHAAAQILPVRLAEAWSWVRAVKRHRDPRTLHDLRISVRRLRYSMEIYAPSFGGPLLVAIDEVKRAQDLLGRLHDGDVALQYLEQYRAADDQAFRPARPPHSRAAARIRTEQGALEKIAETYRRERDELYPEFLKYWSQIGRQRLRARVLRFLKESARPGT